MQQHGEFKEVGHHTTYVKYLVDTALGWSHCCALCNAGSAALIDSTPYLPATPGDGYEIWSIYTTTL